jgi:hypothetical protein
MAFSNYVSGMAILCFFLETLEGDMMSAGVEIEIWGKYQNTKELLDTADSEKEAEAMVTEYRMAFGPTWVVWSKRAKRAKQKPTITTPCQSSR